ncbi:PilW family protein [Acinetobacter sp.]|jgi:Tfp pilus assembly protein PilE|uniref:PilW family protein n=1 Tax=Acinetobacter sp. TaxID=472 RepID=UPI0035B046D9
MKKQTGATLISLLIGLVIAMFCILAILSSYRTVVKTGVESRIAATHDTELQSGLTAAQMFLQNAGFGLDGANHFLITDMQIESNNLSVVLWRYNNGSKVICEGLADAESGDKKKRRLVFLEGLSDESGSPCNSTLSLGAFKWKVKSTLANLEDYSADKSNPKQIMFKQTALACSPYGAGDADETTPHPLITIEAQTSTQKLAGLEKVQIPVCLLNIAS